MSGDKSQGAIIIASDDGIAQLEIPKSALPEGVSPEEISVTNISTEDGLTYDLKPNGLQFNENILFQITIADAGNSVPMLFHITDEDNVESVGDTEVIMDLEAKQTVVSAPISHFSTMYISGFLSGRTSAKAFFAVNTSASDAFVGENVSGKIVITKTGAEINDSYKVTSWTYALRAAQFSGVFTGDRPISPERIPDAPRLSAFTGNTYTVPVNGFTCINEGKAIIGYTMDLKWTQTVTFDRPGAFVTEENKEAKVTVITPEFRCMAVVDADTTGVDVTEPTEDIETGGIQETGPTIEMTYAHVKPGEYSEVYLSVAAAPGIKVKATLSGSGMTTETQELVTDENGVAYFTWRIYSSGQYNATMNIGGKVWHRSVNVQ